jgi:hypothetical protein
MAKRLLSVAYPQSSPGHKRALVILDTSMGLFADFQDSSRRECYTLQLLAAVQPRWRTVPGRDPAR